CTKLEQSCPPGRDCFKRQQKQDFRRATSGVPAVARRPAEGCGMQNRYFVQRHGNHIAPSTFRLPVTFRLVPVVVSSFSPSTVENGWMDLPKKGARSRCFGNAAPLAVLFRGPLAGGPPPNPRPPPPQPVATTPPPPPPPPPPPVRG